MKNIKTYFLAGLLLLIPISILYQLLTIVAGIVNPFINLPLILNFIIGIGVIILLGWIVIHIFKKRLQKRLIATSKKTGLFAAIATGILEFDNLSNKAHTAFKNPILYKVDDGIYKLGYITNESISLVEDAIWIYAPNPINFLGELILVKNSKIQLLTNKQIKNLPLFLLSGAMLQK